MSLVNGRFSCDDAFSDDKRMKFLQAWAIYSFRKRREDFFYLHWPFGRNFQIRGLSNQCVTYCRNSKCSISAQPNLRKAFFWSSNMNHQFTAQIHIHIIVCLRNKSLLTCFKDRQSGLFILFFYSFGRKFLKHEALSEHNRFHNNNYDTRFFFK